MHRILYLGTDPSRYIHSGVLIHCPIIQTKRVPIDAVTKRLWPEITHVLFTSPSAVLHWPFSLDGKEVLTIGEGTASKLNTSSLTAPYATQEGVIALLETLDLSKAFLLWPRSSSSRSLLLEYFTERKIRVHVFDLYETCVKKPDVLPDLSNFDEIVFTSPSTVRAFVQLFGSIPEGKKITPIGPITFDALQFYTKRNPKIDFGCADTQAF